MELLRSAMQRGRDGEATEHQTYIQSFTGQGEAGSREVGERMVQSWATCRSGSSIATWSKSQQAHLRSLRTPRVLQWTTSMSWLVYNHKRSSGFQTRCYASSKYQYQWTYTRYQGASRSI